MHEIEATEFVHKFIESEAERHFSNLKYDKDSIYYNKLCSHYIWVVFVTLLGSSPEEKHYNDARAFLKFREYTWVQFYRYLNEHGTEHIEEYLCYLPTFHPDNDYSIE